MPEGNNHLLPGSTNDSWRTWLVTGSRRGPVDRRRLRGAHRGLKQMLIEGAGDPTRPHSWKEFSDAMVRHAVDEAMRALPTEETAVVKLAFFGGYSNREIAHQMRLTEATVQRRLREALDKISEYVQRGRTMGRRALYALVAWLSARWLNDMLHQSIESAAVATAAAIIIIQPVPIINPAIGTSPHQPATTSAAAVESTVVPPMPTPTPTVSATQGSQPASAPALPLPAVPTLPPIPIVKLPPLPNPPTVKTPSI